jgi:hypothetical protein
MRKKSVKASNTRDTCAKWNMTRKARLCVGPTLYDATIALLPPPPADAKAVRTTTTGKAGRRRRWTLQEDTALTHAIGNQEKNNQNKIDWRTIATLVSGGRTKGQCLSRWHDTLNVANPTSTGWTPLATGAWSAEEDDQLKDAVKRYSGKNWREIAAMVPGRTKRVCANRWQNVLDPSIDQTSRTPGRTGAWTTNEDDQLRAAVQRYNASHWKEIAALVPGRTKTQCTNRWHDLLERSVDRTPRLSSRWTPDEDDKLKDAVLRYGANNWIEIAKLVPGRTRRQCTSRWYFALDPSLDKTPGRTGKWTACQRRQPTQRSGTNVWWQELETNYRNGSVSNQKTVYEAMAWCVGSWRRMDARTLTHADLLARNMNTSATREKEPSSRIRCRVRGV